LTAPPPVTTCVVVNNRLVRAEMWTERRAQRGGINLAARFRLVRSR
jgi:hypothetical protein